MDSPRDGKNNFAIVLNLDVCKNGIVEFYWLFTISATAVFVGLILREEWIESQGGKCVNNAWASFISGVRFAHWAGKPTVAFIRILYRLYGLLASYHCNLWNIKTLVAVLSISWTGYSTSESGQIFSSGFDFQRSQPLMLKYYVF